MKTNTLEWAGPFRFQELGEAIDDANGRAGVYLLIQQLASVPSVYVGSSSDIGRRFQSHIKDTLAFNYFVRKPDGEWWPKESPPQAFWSRVSDLRNEMDVCVEALERTRFTWAETPLDAMNTIERAIYAQMVRQKELGHIAIHNGAPPGASAGQIAAIDITWSSPDAIIQTIGAGCQWPVTPSS